MTYIKPQVIIHQEFSQSTTADETTMRAMIVGPNALLHRYSDASEKLEIALGEYTPGEEIVKLYPERSDGGVVDKDYSKLYVDDALIQYYEDLTQTATASGGNPGVCSVVNKPNIIKTNKNLISNGSQYPRDDEDFGSRDVQIGDYAWVRSYVGNGTPADPCDYEEHISKIIGFAPNIEPASIGTVSPANITSNTTGGEPTQVPGENNSAATLTVDATAYDKLAAGNAEPYYTITVSKISSSINCTKSVQLNVVSNNGDSVYGLDIFESAETTTETIVDTPADPEHDVEAVTHEESVTTKFYSFDIGTYGLKGRLDNVDNLKEGDTWTWNQKFGYTIPTLTVTGPYTGDENDTYIVTFTKGGSFDRDGNAIDAPKMSIRTALGLDYVEEVDITKKNVPYKVGGNGLYFQINGDVATGQAYTFTVNSSYNAAVQGIILQNDLPEVMQSTNANTIALDIRLFKKANIVLTATNELTPSNPNFVQEETQVKISGSIQLYDPEFVSLSGRAIPLTLAGGKMYFEYREWLQTMVGEINYCDSTAALDLIPGQLDPENPVKYAVYKALANSNGVPVAYTAVANDNDDDAWFAAFATITGAEDVYSITPTTQNVRLLNQAATVIEAESGAEECRWKTGVFSIPREDECMLVGQNTLNNDLFTTSSDGKPVLATFTDNPLEDGTQITRVAISSKNADFYAYGVKPGDEVRIIKSESQYKYNSYTVDSVVSAESLLLTTSLDAELTVGNRIEVWHKLTRTEQAQRYGNLAASFASRRIMVVAPDKVGEEGKALPGYYLAAAVSGFKSGINAYQGMTRTEINGFDDYSRTKPYWNESQLNMLAESGVCIVVEDANGMPYIRHALTTNMSSTETREEVITRDYDYICKVLHSWLQAYIGKSSITEELLVSLELRLQLALQTLSVRGYITSYKDLEVKQHDILKDRLVVSLNITLPYPVNNIEVYVVA